METIFHGSDHIINKSEYGMGNLNNDYGRGFYCTKSIELAKEWACQKGADGYANEYRIDTTELNVINLNQDPYNILNWLAVLTRHRTYWENGSISENAKEYLQENFYVDISVYDIVTGYRADDSYFSFARDFVFGAISLQKLKRAMHLGELGEQIVLISSRSFEKIEYCGYEEASADIYYPKKTERDANARLAYRKDKAENTDINELFMIDIMREGIVNGDPRLQ